MSAAPPPAEVLHPSHAAPGTDGLWTFLFIDMVVFLMIFVVYMGERSGQVELYSASQVRLDEWSGLAGTLLLLTSSWMVAEAVSAARRHEAGRVHRCLALAWWLGLAFALNKAAEYGLKIGEGLTPVTNPFFSFYYLITFIHLVHVLVGMAFLAYCRRHASTRLGSASYLTGLENVGLFWHLVDVLWIFIFPMLYLVGRVE